MTQLFRLVPIKPIACVFLSVPVFDVFLHGDECEANRYGNTKIGPSVDIL